MFAEAEHGQRPKLAATVENSEDGIFPEGAGDDGDPKVDRPRLVSVFLIRAVETSVLIDRMLRDIERGKNLEPGDRLTNVVRIERMIDVVEDAVDPNADIDIFLEGFEMHVAGSDRQRAPQNVIDDADHRKVFFIRHAFDA